MKHSPNIWMFCRLLFSTTVSPQYSLSSVCCSAWCSALRATSPPGSCPAQSESSSTWRWSPCSPSWREVTGPGPSPTLSVSWGRLVCLASVCCRDDLGDRPPPPHRTVRTWSDPPLPRWSSWPLKTYLDKYYCCDLLHSDLSISISTEQIKLITGF